MRARGEPASAWARVGLGCRNQAEGEGEEGEVEREEEVWEDDDEGGVEGFDRPCSGERWAVGGRSVAKWGETGPILRGGRSEAERVTVES